MICQELGTDPQLLSVLAGPAVAHFCGHRIANQDERGRFAPEAEAIVARRIAEVLERHPAAYAYGSLASGADIMWSEALLERGSELHVVLPFALDEFVERSVAPSGPGWVDRFHRCLAAAASVHYATDDAFLGDDVLFRYGSELAMGLALLRARYLDAEARQLAVWDGGLADGAAGTSIDVATWRRRGGQATLISPGPDGQVTEVEASHARAGDAVSETSGATDEGSDPGPRGAAPRRVVRAMLFGDIRGFSKLTDEQLPIFAVDVLGAFAGTLRRHDDDVQHRNTWGDAVYAVLSDAPVAAACALELQDAMMAIDLEGEGLPATPRTPSRRPSRPRVPDSRSGAGPTRVHGFAREPYGADRARDAARGRRVRHRSNSPPPSSSTGATDSPATTSATWRLPRTTAG